MKPFGVAKFQKLLLAGSFTVLASYFVRLASSVIAGNLIGEDALAGVNLVGPCLSAIAFVSGLIGTGCGTQYSIAMGKCDVLRARQFFMQAVWSCCIVGGCLGLLMFFGSGQFMRLMGASEAVSRHAIPYMRWIAPVAVADGLMALMETLGYADGDSRLCTLAYVTVFVSNVLVSLLAVLLGMGIAGCALGALVANLAGMAVLSRHFFKKSNTFRPVVHFSLKDSWRIVRASFGDAAAFLCDGLLFLFLNMFVIAHYGSEMLPVVGVVTSVWGFLEFFNGIGVAVQPIVTVYHGEGNTRALRTVMNSAMKVALVEGAAIACFVWVFPNLVVGMLGIETPALTEMAVVAIRGMGIGFVALAFAGLFNSYYMFVEQPLMAGMVTFLCYLICPMAAVAAGSVLGIGWMWCGIGAGPILGIAITSAFIVLVGGRKMFPLMIGRSRDARLAVFDLSLVPQEIVNVSRLVAGTLKEAGKEDRLCMRASLMAEEVLMAVRDRNGERRIAGEVTLDWNDGVLMTLRDDGEIFDITDVDQQVSSLRTFLVASMMLNHDGHRNLVTTGFNRNVFRF